MGGRRLVAKLFSLLTVTNITARLLLLDNRMQEINIDNKHRSFFQPMTGQGKFRLTPWESPVFAKPLFLPGRRRYLVRVSCRSET